MPAESPKSPKEQPPSTATPDDSFASRPPGCGPLGLIAVLLTLLILGGGTNAAGAKSKMPPTLLVPVQSKDSKDLAAGKLLVASRDLADPNFAKTVILLIHYEDQGVVGLILNRRTKVALSQVLEGFQGAKDRSDLAYLGGPVEVPAMFALLKSTAKVEGAERIFSGVYLISTKTLFEQTLAARPDPQAFHVYLGYAGWTKDQLRKEVELGAWFIFAPDTGTVFDSDPSSLWPRMIQKTELRLANSEPASAHSQQQTMARTHPSALSVQVQASSKLLAAQHLRY